MDLVELTPERLDNVKHVLFGNQKQANVINDAVAQIVAEGVAELTDVGSLDSEDFFIGAVYDLLTNVVNGTARMPEKLMALICGYESVKFYNESGPKIVTKDIPNPESPKVLFRIYPLGANDASTENKKVVAGESGTEITHTVKEMPPEVKVTRDENAYEHVQVLISKLAPLCPSAPARELGGDKILCALYASEYYFSSN